MDNEDKLREFRQNNFGTDTLLRRSGAPPEETAGLFALRAAVTFGVVSCILAALGCVVLAFTAYPN